MSPPKPSSHPKRQQNQRDGGRPEHSSKEASSRFVDLIARKRLGRMLGHDHLPDIVVSIPLPRSSLVIVRRGLPRPILEVAVRLQIVPGVEWWLPIRGASKIAIPRDELGIRKAH